MPEERGRRVSGGKAGPGAGTRLKKSQEKVFGLNKFVGSLWMTRVLKNMKSLANLKLWSTHCLSDGLKS